MSSYDTFDLTKWATVPFTGQDELMTAMRDPRYSSYRDDTFRNAVAAKLDLELQTPESPTGAAASPTGGTDTYQVTGADVVVQNGPRGPVLSLSTGAQASLDASRAELGRQFGPQSVTPFDGSIGASVSHNGLPRDVRGGE